jgi:uncharacterized protein GlcG (DUF336 family)
MSRLKTLLSLSQATTIIDAALAAGHSAGFMPLTVVVLDNGGHLIALKRADGSGILRSDVAIGKAWGALGLGLSSRALGANNTDRPVFLNALAAASDGRCVPVAGGVLISDDSGEVIGAVGISGDNSDNDEHCALAGIKAAGLAPA